MSRLALVSFVLLTSCSPDQSVFVKPDPSGASSAAASGSGGDGLLCDPCESHNGSRLIRRKTIITSSDGMVDVQYNGLYFDTLRDEHCFSYTAEDGVQRCLPNSSFTALVYADAECTIPLAQFDTCSALPKTTLVPSVLIPGTCTKSYYLAYLVGPEYIGQSYLKQSSGCTQLGVSVDKLYSLSKIQASEFAELTIESKP